MNTMNKELAELILRLTYSELKAVGSDLHRMCTDGEPDPVRGVPISPEDFVELLHDWAEAQ